MVDMINTTQEMTMISFTLTGQQNQLQGVTPVAEYLLIITCLCFSLCVAVSKKQGVCVWGINK